MLPLTNKQVYASTETRLNWGTLQRVPPYRLHTITAIRRICIIFEQIIPVYISR